jgi:hypothetical protein
MHFFAARKHIPVTETISRRKLSLWAVILVLPAFGQAPPDFRKTTWGSTVAAVIAAEAAQPSQVREAEGETVVRYDGIKLAGLDASVVYIFAQDRLVRAKYLVTATHPGNLNQFIADYRAVEPVLRAANGQPSDQKAVWLDDSLQEERKSYLDQDRALAEDILPSDRNVGLAVSKGFLKLYTEWTTSRTHILHALTGAGGAITHQIEYRSAELSPLEDQIRQQGTKQ